MLGVQHEPAPRPCPGLRPLTSTVQRAEAREPWHRGRRRGQQFLGSGQHRVEAADVTCEENGDLVTGSAHLMMALGLSIPYAPGL